MRNGRGTVWVWRAAVHGGAAGLGNRDQVPPLRHHFQDEAPEPQLRTPASVEPRRSRVWLYIPKAFVLEMTCQASPSAPASAASNSACTWPNPDIELFAMSSGTHSLRPLSWRGWRTRPWMTLLSGLTLEPSTAALGAARFVSSLPAIPASHSPRPAGSSGATIPATSGPKSPASPARSSRSSSSSRTSKATSIWDCPKSSARYAAWAIA